MVFDDGSVAHDVDVIINCTGYTIDLPFLSDDITDLIVDSESNDLKVMLGASMYTHSLRTTFVCLLFLLCISLPI